MNKKVVVAGHICLDITPVFPGSITAPINEILNPGKLVRTDGVKISTGGTVANTGLAMKKLGADVSLMGKVGNDDFGELICSILKKYDADKGIIKAEGEETSYSVVLALPNTDRIFLHCPGANDTFVADDIDLSKLKDVSLFHFGYPPIMEKMFENDGEELESLLIKVKAEGLATSLDMTAVDPNSKAGKADWEKIIKRTLPLIDFFVPSIEELCYMLDKKKFNEWQVRAAGRDITEIINLENDIKPLADKCMKLGAKILLLKCGVKGLYFRSANEKALGSISKRIELDVKDWANKDFFTKSFKPDKVLSATGAGDTSIAAFLTAMLNGESAEESVILASATGACCVEEYDALSGLKSFKELKEKIASSWEQNE